MPRYKRHGQERSKQHCSKCGKEGIIGESGLCKRCRRDAPRDLVVGDTYSYEELSEMFGVDITEDSRIVVID